MAVLDYLGSIFQEFERFLTESVSDLNFKYQDGILKVKLYVADERTFLRLSRGIC